MKTQHYYTENQTTPFQPRLINVRVLGKLFELYTAGGVFSPKKLDAGSKLLIETAELIGTEQVLDLGCGYGVVGIVLKYELPGISLVSTDTNERAIKLTLMNAKKHRIDINAFKSEGFLSKKFLNVGDFDLILLNPPQSAGKKVCEKLIIDSYEHLVYGGKLNIVVRHQKGGKELSRIMKERFGNMKDIAKKSGYRIYQSVKNEE